MRLVRRGLVIPACAERMAKEHWFVQVVVEWAKIVYANRANLDRPVRDPNGHVLVPALREWMIRPFDHEDDQALDKRRADFMRVRLQVLLIVVAHMSFREKVVLPEPNASDYMTLEQIGRELPDRKCKDPVDAIERAMRFLKKIGFFSKVVQHRQKLTEGPNAGKFRSYGAALRRVGTEWFGAMEGKLAGAWQRLQNYLKGKAKTAREKKKKADDAFTDALTRESEPLVVPPRAPPPPAAEPDPLWDEVETDHPEWVRDNDVMAIRAEVRRRQLAARQHDTS